MFVFTLLIITIIIEVILYRDTKKKKRKITSKLLSESTLMDDHLNLEELPIKNESIPYTRDDLV